MYSSPRQALPSPSTPKQRGLVAVTWSSQRAAKADTEHDLPAPQLANSGRRAYCSADALLAVRSTSRALEPRQIGMDRAERPAHAVRLLHPPLSRADREAVAAHIAMSQPAGTVALGLRQVAAGRRQLAVLAPLDLRKRRARSGPQRTGTHRAGSPQHSQLIVIMMGMPVRSRRRAVLPPGPRRRTRPWPAGPCCCWPPRRPRRTKESSAWRPAGPR